MRRVVAMLSGAVGLAAVVAVLAWVIGFGFVSARTAIGLDRAGVTWFVFGAILGPIALALLQAAPPGLCRSCWGPTRGWLTVCLWCHQDVRATPPDTIDILARMSKLSRAGDQRRDLDRPAPIIQAHQAREPTVIALATPTTGHIESTPPATWAPAVLREGAARSNENGSPAPIGRPTPAASRDAGGVTPKAVETTVLPTAIYITGSTALEPGRRYAIAINESRLRFLGPVDVDPSVVALERILAVMNATAIKGRLVVSEPGNRSGVVLAFMSVDGATSDDLASAIVDAARAAAHP